MKQIRISYTLHLWKAAEEHYVVFFTYEQERST